MGKKSQRTSRTSKGVHGVVANKHRVRAADRSYVENFLIAQDAWYEGKNPWVTIENPNKNETAKRHIRVKADQYFGYWKDVRFGPPRKDKDKLNAN